MLQEIIEYLDQLHSPDDAGLTLAFAAPDEIAQTQMTPSEAKLLRLLVRLIRPSKIVEIGTLFGYTAIHLARGLVPGGRLWSIEREPSYAERARANISVAGVADRVTVLAGDARQVLPTLSPHAPFDAVFIDANKDSYDVYGAWAIEHLRPGGLVIGDNAYLFGELLDDDARACGMRRFHELVCASCDSVCAPTPEGLVVGIKR